MNYGVITYDIPVNQRNLYLKVRSRVRRYGLPMTMSAYLINWGHRDEIDAILSTASQADPHVNYSIVKFDGSETERLDRMAGEALSKFLSDSRKFMLGQMKKMEEDVTNAEKAKSALGAARRRLTEAKSLALAFLLSNKFEDQFKMFEKLIDTQVEMMKAQGVTPTSGV